MIRDFVEFNAGFKAEPLEEGPDIGAPTEGNLLISAFAEHLKKEGFTVSDISSYEGYGWEFTASKSKKRIWCMVQCSDKWLAITRDSSGIISRLFGDPDSVHQRVCLGIHQVLTTDSRFSAPMWFSRKDYNSKALGSSSPL